MERIMRKTRTFLLAAGLVMLLACLVSSCSMPFGMQIKIQNDSSQNVNILMCIGNTNGDGSMLFENFYCASNDSELVDVESTRITVKSWSPSSLKVTLDSSAKTIYVKD
jgi:hypothetical protein